MFFWSFVKKFNRRVFALNIYSELRRHDDEQKFVFFKFKIQFPYHFAYCHFVQLQIKNSFHVNNSFNWQIVVFALSSTKMRTAKIFHTRSENRFQVTDIENSKLFPTFTICFLAFTLWQ